MAQKPSIPKGTRDFNPEQVAKRNYIFNTIQNQFEKFGFQPIETPSFENSETLMGKYGDEGDRLIFKILNSGEYFEDVKDGISTAIRGGSLFYREYIKNENDTTDWNYRSSRLEFVEKFKDSIKRGSGNKILNKLPSDDILQYIFSLIQSSYKHTKEEEIEKSLSMIYANLFLNIKSNSITPTISEKALRYDLTVPFARYVVQHQNEIEFPFKRYQMQPVWRADRPQKGRFREFYQCDADVVGSTSLWQEVEFVQLYDAVFTALGLTGTTIKINNRKILSGIAEVIGASDKLIDFTVALDKLDKIGEEKVKQEMLDKGISQSGISKLQPLFSLSGDFGSQISQLKDILNTSEDGKKGIEELEFIDNAISELGLQTAKLQLDVTLARGLNYYTGAIFEVSAPEGVNMGSIGGGGRYDDLTGIFGMPNMSGVGISFGLDRIYLVLEELGLFPETVSKNIDVLFINFGEKEALYSLKAIKQLRSKGINAELYPDSAKMKKQMQHANKRHIPYVVLVGEQEMAKGAFTLKNMHNGEQSEVSLNELISQLQ
ncbi:histidine--tRNA ligase [Hanstruepera marina]|uniref:histidine--tRNA ligase n=1 Tax=Hanstruepera marina TaxID=2873265 RepID=UPI001CA76B92|nr:histidine--tRNA ligase [Hanstruepera marina]